MKLIELFSRPQYDKPKYWTIKRQGGYKHLYIIRVLFRPINPIMNMINNAIN